MDPPYLTLLTDPINELKDVTLNSLVDPFECVLSTVLLALVPGTP